MSRDDAVDGVVLPVERDDVPAPANLGAGREIAIRELVDPYAEATGFASEINPDPMHAATAPSETPASE